MVKSSGRAGHAVLIRPVVHNRRVAAEVVVRRRCSGGPFQCSGFPRIVARLRPLLHAPEQIDHEDELGRDGDERRIGHELIAAASALQVGQLRELRIAPRLAGHAQIVHRHEDGVGADQRQEEMDLPSVSFIMRPNILGNQ